MSSQLKIERINASFKNLDVISDVLVVWVANNPKSGGNYIVGWYRDAEVYRSEQRDIEERNYGGEIIGYYVKAKKGNVTLLPIDERTYLIPRGKDGFGQNPVWYAEKQDDLKKRIIQYIDSYEQPKLSKFIFFHYDKERAKQAEKNAINAVTSYYHDLGYSVISREKDNIGWDLEVEKKSIKLLVEVKGTSGSEISVQLTPNELKKMKDNKDKGYRIAIVTEALSSHPKLCIFFYSNTQDSDEGWYDESGSVKLDFEEVVFARVTSVNH